MYHLKRKAPHEESWQTIASYSNEDESKALEHIQSIAGTTSIIDRYDYYYDPNGVHRALVETYFLEYEQDKED